MTEKIVAINNEDEMRQFSKEVAQTLNGGEMIALDGDLGAGKTFFTAALCEELGVERKKISSPTYVIMKEYDGKFPIFHWDFYRIVEEDELIAADFLELLKTERAVNIVEWASMYDSFWNEYVPRIEIKIEFEGKDDRRKIRFRKIS
jgi:tRNA threonylcarbamoyladenosine biosynthesis protein TsaE